MAATCAPGDTVFCLLSFEGPDPYAQAGGLGVRVTHLAETLASHGFETHLFFVGDPACPGEELRLGGRLILHRWGQWISAHHPVGVYDGEDGKVRDFTASLPSYLLERILRPAVAAGRLPVVLAEEWHTAEAVIRLSEALHQAGLRRRCVLFWNANNTMGFHRIDWWRLQAAATVTTVSRYMRHLMDHTGTHPLVIPNGIPSELLHPVPTCQVTGLRRALRADAEAVLLFKVGRFDPAKNWLMAVEVAAQLRALGLSVIFPLRGGIEPHGSEVLDRARRLGLRVMDVHGAPTTVDALLHLLRACHGAEILNLRFSMAQALLRPCYAAADLVLANSNHEPFGLVGLEAMAAGGVVATGVTGEEYTLGGRGAVVLDTDAPGAVVRRVLDLKAEPSRAAAIRQLAPKLAADFTWERILGVLLDKVAFVAEATGVSSRPTRGSAAAPTGQLEPLRERAEAFIVPIRKRPHAAGHRRARARSSRKPGPEAERRPFGAPLVSNDARGVRRGEPLLPDAHR